MKTFFQIIFLSIILQSCQSTEVLRSKLTVAGPHHFSEIDMRFKNEADTNSIYENSLLFILNHVREKNPLEIHEWKDVTVNIKSEEHKIIATGFIGDSIVFNKELNGYITNNCFHLNRKTRLKGIPPFFFTFEQSYVALTLDENNDLWIAHSAKSMGGIFFFMANYNQLYTKKYSKINS